MTAFTIDTRHMTSATVTPKKMPLLYAGLFGAAMAVAGPTVGVTSPSPSAVQFSQSWTTGVNAPVRPDTASAVRRLKERSGLSWQQLADAFGVTRRALHFWVNGGKMAPASEERLRTLTQVIDGFRSANPKIVREALLAPGTTGVSKLVELTSAVTPRRVGARRSIADQLNAVQDDTKHSGRVISSTTVPVKLPEL